MYGRRTFPSRTQHIHTLALLYTHSQNFYQISPKEIGRKKSASTAILKQPLKRRKNELNKAWIFVSFILTNKEK